MLLLVFLTTFCTVLAKTLQAGVGYTDGGNGAAGPTGNGLYGAAESSAYKKVCGLKLVVTNQLNAIQVLTLEEFTIRFVHPVLHPVK
jgi:hypothetical protein